MMCLLLSLVSISAAIIVPSIIVAFNLKNIEDFLKKHRKVKSAGAAPAVAGPSGVGTVVGEKPPEDLEADGRRKQKLLDEEQGRKSAKSSL